MLAGGLRMRAQDEPTFTSGVKVVNLLASVFTKRGEILRDLTKDDFTLAENGHPQTIRYFSRETDLPLTIGLLVDTSMSQERLIAAERAASFRFIDRVLRENKDQVFVLQFDLAPLLRQPLTSSRKELDQALSMVDTPTHNELMAGVGTGTSLYDAVIHACTVVLRQQQNRKALILMTDGDDNSSEHSLTDAIEAAQRAETLVYSILFADSSRQGFGAHDGRGVLQRLSRETGAGFFEVSKKVSLDDIFGTIQDQLRSQFSIGYVSDQPLVHAEFRKIQLATKQKGLVVQTRERYWAVH